LRPVDIDKATASKFFYYAVVAYLFQDVAVFAVHMFTSKIS